MSKTTHWPSFEGTGIKQAKPLESHLLIDNGVEYAGCHLLLDIWGAKHLNDIPLIEACFHRCIKIAKATLLHLHLHHFNEGDGVSGVAVLAESHISIHTWPEKNFAAFDVFMCGNTHPHKVIPVLLEVFDAQSHELREILRGKMPD